MEEQGLIDTNDPAPAAAAPDTKPAEPPFEPIDGTRLLASFTRHVQFVREGLHLVTGELERRGIVHDASKMLADEFAGFSKINAHARIHKFGSPEYRAGLADQSATINLHYGRNTHHPEGASLRGVGAAKGSMFDDPHHPGSEVPEAPENDMTFLDVIEMVCDWWGARKGYNDERPWPIAVQMSIQTKAKYLKPWQLELVHSVAAFLDGTGRS